MRVTAETKIWLVLRVRKVVLIVLLVACRAVQCSV